MGVTLEQVHLSFVSQIDMIDMSVVADWCS